MGAGKNNIVIILEQKLCRKLDVSDFDLNFDKYSLVPRTVKCLLTFNRMDEDG